MSESGTDLFQGLVDRAAGILTFDAVTFIHEIRPPSLPVFAQGNHDLAHARITAPQTSKAGVIAEKLALRPQCEHSLELGQGKICKIIEGFHRSPCGKLEELLKRKMEDKITPLKLVKILFRADRRDPAEGLCTILSVSHFNGQTFRESQILFHRDSNERANLWKLRLIILGIRLLELPDNLDYLNLCERKVSRTNGIPGESK